VSEAVPRPERIQMLGAWPTRPRRERLPVHFLGLGVLPKNRIEASTWSPCPSIHRATPTLFAHAVDTTSPRWPYSHILGKGMLWRVAVLQLSFLVDRFRIAISQVVAIGFWDGATALIRKVLASQLDGALVIWPAMAEVLHRRHPNLIYIHEEACLMASRRSAGKSGS